MIKVYAVELFDIKGRAVYTEFTSVLPTDAEILEIIGNGKPAKKIAYATVTERFTIPQTQEERGEAAE